MDDNLRQLQTSYHLILADTGMGKTTFCLNYFAHCRKLFPQYEICLVSLATKNAEQLIGSILNKSETILIADALDEDAKGFGRGRDRLAEVLEAAADYKAVIITCRSQYFTSDDAILRETPLPVLVPRQLGQSPTFALMRSYISPFSAREVQTYIRRHFPLYFFWRYPSRMRAQQLAASVPDLSHRPMLLERLPELARKPTKSTELYDLYDLLVEGWLVRESRWIKLFSLRQVSLELALVMYRDLESRRGRMRPDEIERLAADTLGERPNWRHLTGRSLLNRDSRGNYKFAHKSILEFLVVKSACEGNDRALEMPWTPFMKEIFISWGHSDAGRGSWQRAREILSSPSGRTNIAPLFDMLGTTAVRGLPNFRASCERRQTSTGDRLAPASWRSSSINLENVRGVGIYRIVDHEYNLRWSYMPNRVGDKDLIPTTLLQALRFAESHDAYRLPSFEQFVTLVEGLYRIKKPFLRPGALFVLADKPARHVHLLVQLDSEPKSDGLLKLVDRRRRIVGTAAYINSYTTGSTHSPDFANKIYVDQLFLDDSTT